MLSSTTKVFGIGLSKTGTSSLDRALNDLGVRSIHYPHDPQTFQDLAGGNYHLAILERYQGVTDIPVAPFYPQLDQAYPGAKFILTVRQLDKWLDSVENHWDFMREWAARDEHFRRFSEFITACVYGAHDYQQDRFRYVYDTHEKLVREYFRDRPDDFLVLDLCGGEGWDRLCAFLDVPIPDRPFPHANRREEKEERLLWVERLDEAAVEFRLSVPADTTYVLVDGNQLAGTLLDDPRRARRIVEKNGQYWGNPIDSTAAIDELESLRSSGATYVVLTWPCEWWLEHYNGFADHLSSRYAQSFSGAHLTVYDLKAPLPE